MSERVKTYPWDLVLFKELGLKPFDIKSGYKHHVGKVDFENGSWGRIWVVGKPAQFWRICHWFSPPLNAKKAADPKTDCPLVCSPFQC